MKIPWKYVGVSFLIGLLLGGSIGLFYAHTLAQHWAKKSPEIFLKRLDRDLHLTEAQRTQLLSILYLRRSKIDAYEDQIRHETRLEIRDHLTPAQQVLFDARVARRDAERKKLGLR